MISGSASLLYYCTMPHSSLHAKWCLVVPLWILIYWSCDTRYVCWYECADYFLVNMCCLVLEYNIGLQIQRQSLWILSRLDRYAASFSCWSMLLNCCISHFGIYARPFKYSDSRFGFYHVLDRYAASFSYRSILLGSLNHRISRIGIYAHLPLDFNTPLCLRLLCW